MTTAKGLHLWEAQYGYTIFWITTRLNAPQTAAKRGQQVAKESGERGSFKQLTYRGTIDA